MMLSLQRLSNAHSHIRSLTPHAWVPVLVRLALLKKPSTVICVEVLFTLIVCTWLLCVNKVLKELPF